MKIAFLYAGQGSQKVGMGMDLYQTFPAYKKIIDQIDPMYKQLMHEGPIEKLSQTKFTQPCMAAYAAGVTAVLYEKGIKPDMAAGLSLGEYGALHAAGVFDAKEFVELLAFRGKAMEQAAEGIACKMVAVLGTDRKNVQDACKEATDTGNGYVVIANYNCPGQYVLCGEEKAVEYAQELVLKKGAKRCISLNVSGPFHTKFMKPAGDALREKFSEITFQKPCIPIVYNATGDLIRKGETTEALLVKQVQSSVYFEDSIRKIIEEGVDTFIEIGPGRVLSGFVKKIDRNVTLFKIETVDDFELLINKMEDGKV